MPTLADWVGFVPSQFNMVCGQNFGTTTLPQIVSWALNGVSLSTGQTGPDGTATATKLIQQTVGGNQHFIFFNQNINAGFGGTQYDIPFRVEAIAKQVEMTRIVIQVLDGVNNDQISVGVDLAGGNIGYDNQVTNWVINAATMTQPFGPYGPLAGWWLITIDFTPAGPNKATVNNDVRIFLDNGSGTAARSITYAADGVSGVLLWYVVELPRAAWLFTGETFRDDFTSLNTIDVNDTRDPKLGFNWFVHNRWPLAQSVGGPFWNSGTPTPPANIVQSSPSVVKFTAPDQFPAFVFTSVAADPVTSLPTILGPTFQAPCIIEGCWAYDPSTVLGYTGDTGSLTAFWSISLALLQGNLTNACEIDMADQFSATNQYPWNVSARYSNSQGGTTLAAFSAGFGPNSNTDFRQIATMLFDADKSTNFHGFAMSFWKEVGNTQTINSQLVNNCTSAQWTNTSPLHTQRFMINATAGLGNATVGGNNVPFNIPVLFDWIRIIGTAPPQQQPSLAPLGVVDQNTAKVVPLDTIAVTTLVNGVPTITIMEVVSISDESGEIIKDFATGDINRQQLDEWRAIRALLGQPGPILQ